LEGPTLNERVAGGQAWPALEGRKRGLRGTRSQSVGGPHFPFGSEKGAGGRVFKSGSAKASGEMSGDWRKKFEKPTIKGGTRGKEARKKIIDTVVGQKQENSHRKWKVPAIRQKRP